MRADGTVRYTFRQAKQALSLFRALAAGRGQPLTELDDAFDRETENGRKMEKYEGLLAAALRSIAGAFRGAEQRALTQGRGMRFAKASERPAAAADFELITWLVIAEKKADC